MPACGGRERNWLDWADLFERVRAQTDIGGGLVEPQRGGPIWWGIFHRIPAARSTAQGRQLPVLARADQHLCSIGFVLPKSNVLIRSAPDDWQSRAATNWLRFAKIAPRGAMHSNFPSLGYNILSGEMPIAFASAGLPARFVLISGAMLPQILLNVPLTTTLLTHGAAVLFLLWYVKQIEN
jgi:hypothetical protein